MKNLGRDNISMAFYGEGAANQGQVAESFNIAKLWDLPVIFVCENNQIARNAEVHRTTACTKFYTRGDYVPGIWVSLLGFNQQKYMLLYFVKFEKKIINNILLYCPKVSFNRQGKPIGR